jgi:hypothetical protein
MDSFIVSGIFGLAGMLAFFGGIALLMWIDQRGKATQRQLQHEERLRSLELGRELPDAAVARAEASSSRAWAAAVVGFLVPPIVLGAGVGASALVLMIASEYIHLPVLCIIWGVCGLIALVAVVSSLGAMKQQSPPESAAAEFRPVAVKSVRSDPSPEPRPLDLEIVAQER